MRYASLLGRLLYGAIGFLGGALLPSVSVPKPLSPNTTNRPVKPQGRWREEPPRIMPMNGDREVARRRRQHVDVIYRTPAGDVGYGFGRNTFHGVPVRYAAERIANAMAEHLVSSEQFIKWSGVKPDVPAERK